MQYCCIIGNIAVGWSKTVQHIIEQNVLMVHSFFVLVNQGCNTCHDQIKVSVEVYSKYVFTVLQQTTTVSQNPDEFSIHVFITEDF